MPPALPTPGQLEDALRRAEIKYRIFLEQSPDAIVVIDPSTTLPIEFNDEACRQLNCTRDQFARLKIADYAADATPAEIQAAIAQVLKAGRAEFESRRRTRTGERLHTWVTVRAVDVEGRQVLYSIWRDTTEQKQAEEELQRREQYFRALTELASDVVAVLSEDGLIRYASSSVTSLLGFTPEELRGRSAFELLHPEDKLLARDVLHRLSESDDLALAELEARVRRQDETWRVVEVVGRNLLHDPTVAGIILNVRDVTERKRAQSRIREQAALLDKAQDAILVCDLESRILFWNRSAERVYGWSAAEALGKNADELLYASAAGRPIAAVKGLIAEGEWHGELAQVHRSGQEIFVESRWSLVRNDEGEAQSILVINTNVTEARKLQARFLRAQRMESVGALAGGIAHDLNNVLAPVLMAADLLRDKVTDPDCQQWLQTLTESATRGAAVIRQILSFARGTGEQVVELQLRHLLREHERILKETFPRSIAISTSIPRDLWQVKGNPTQISQVLMNLSVNARDAMPDGGKLLISARNLVVDEKLARSRPELKPGPYAAISVADTGTGIPVSIRNRIFEPFFTTKDVTKGTGLGLATAQGIVKSHSGALTVDSEEGKGTQFDLYLPALATESALQEPVLTPRLPRGAGECILVVEDEAHSREMLAATLESYGYRVLAAHDGADGLKLFTANQGQIALVLTDMAMPVMDGPALIRAVRNIQPRVAILGLSGLIDHSGLSAAGAAGIQILQKPFTAADLILGVQRLLGESGPG